MTLEWVLWIMLFYFEHRLVVFPVFRSNSLHQLHPTATPAEVGLFSLCSMIGHCPQRPLNLSHPLRLREKVGEVQSPCSPCHLRSRFHYPLHPASRRIRSSSPQERPPYWAIVHLWPQIRLLVQHLSLPHPDHSLHRRESHSPFPAHLPRTRIYSLLPTRRCWVLVVRHTLKHRLLCTIDSISRRAKL
jgi:hypothetical protein